MMARRSRCWASLSDDRARACDTLPHLHLGIVWHHHERAITVSRSIHPVGGAGDVAEPRGEHPSRLRRSRSGDDSCSQLDIPPLPTNADPDEELLEEVGVGVRALPSGWPQDGGLLGRPLWRRQEKIRGGRGRGISGMYERLPSTAVVASATASVTVSVTASVTTSVTASAAAFTTASAAASASAAAAAAAAAAAHGRQRPLRLRVPSNRCACV